VLDYSARIAGQLSQQVLMTRFTRLLGQVQEPGRVELQTRAWFNANLESRNFYVPGVIAIVVMLITLIV
jgi:ABC-2 type transport system permease protein